MKNLFENAKKNSLYGLKAKRKLKIMGLAALLLLIVGAICFLTGEASGMVIGTILATGPLAFTLPQDVEFTENERKAVSALAEHFNKQFQEYVKGQKSQEDLIKSFEEELAKKGFSEEKINKLTKGLEDQGKELKKLKENTLPGGVKLGGLHKSFNDDWENLQKAIKERRAGFEIKAIDEHDPELIHTTENIITTTTGATLEEQIGNDPNLYLKRRDRQYIHDIANVSYVNQVPETFSLWKEGDETGVIAVVDENGLKPQVELSLIKNKVESKKAAGYIVVTEEVIKWRARAWAAIQRLFRDKVYRDYENLLTTDLLGNATQYIGTSLDGTIPAAEVTDFTALVAAILQLESLNFLPDTLVINPADKWRLALTQTNNGMFVLPYIQQGGQFGLLGLRVITTNKITAGTFLLGESGTWNIEEEAPTLRTGLVNDDFLHNRMTIIGEIFFLDYVPSNNSGSWILGDFADIKETLAVV